MSKQVSIEEKLTDLLTPSYLLVENESHRHNVPANSETHFKVTAVSESFVGKRLIQRHRTINTALAEELQTGVHALAIHAYSPEEWHNERGEKAPDSPKCMGGSKADSR